MIGPGAWLSTLRDVAVVAFVVSFTFVWGASYVQGFMNYPYWRDLGQYISPEAFRALRDAHYWKIYPLAVYPGLVTFVANAALLFLPPPSVSRWILPACFALNLVVLVATFAVLVPIQDKIDAGGFDRALIEQLIRGDFWLRKIPGTLCGLLVVGLLWQLVRRGHSESSRVASVSASQPRHRVCG
jgi:hypothetical protein